MDVLPSPSLTGDESEAATNTVSQTPKFSGVGQESESTAHVTPTSPAVDMVSTDARQLDRGEGSRSDSPPAWGGSTVKPWP